MGLLSDLKTLYHVLMRPIRGADHAARMESFYAPQAAAYDASRRRLLPGREELYQSIEVPEGGVWVDMGGGTGANLECLERKGVGCPFRERPAGCVAQETPDPFSAKIAALGHVYVVDLSPSMLAIARGRIQRHGWQNVTAIEADATTFRPPAGSADVVTFSYSLTMIPDWFAALENARAILKPGGLIGVVDFYVSRKHPAAGLARHGWFARTFWPIWFAGANVFPSPDHAAFLHSRFEPVRFCEGCAKVPYLPLLRVPYYIFVGRKPPSW